MSTYSIGIREKRSTRQMRPPKRALAIAVAGVALASGLSWATRDRAQAVEKIASSITASDGTVVTATNHLVTTETAGSYLVVCAGDANAGDSSAGPLVDRAQRRGVNPERLKEVEVPDAAVGNAFLAVIDAGPASKHYGKVVNTVPVSPIPENE